MYKLEIYIWYFNTIGMSIMHISFDKFLVYYEDVTWYARGRVFLIEHGAHNILDLK